MTNMADVLIIGAGSSGEYAASYSAGDDRKVVLVEKSRVGGACVFNACIPTKALVHAARTYQKMRAAGFYGLPNLEKNADYWQVKAFKDRIVEGIGSGRDESMLCFVVLCFVALACVSLFCLFCCLG